MGDFHQNGIITTLHNLARRPLEELEIELIRFNRSRPLGLVLPCLYSELEGPAMQPILEELAKVPYLSEIIIGLDRANEDEYRKALQFFAQLPQPYKVLWNDGPRLNSIHEQLLAAGLSIGDPGKGRNVWFCLGYISSAGRTGAVALHDCDIVTYHRELLARLIYPVAHPQFNYTFCKGFYSRVANGKINGRVSRLLVTPLLRALTKIFGQQDYLEFLDSFRYPLAGEFSMRTDSVNDIRIPSDWGLEIGVLAEMKRNYSTNRICQVDIADTYDHKHQNLSAENDQGGLSKMSIDISKAIFRKLATNGVVFSNETFRSVKATYFRIALDLIETYNNDAQMNGLTLDIHKEEQAVELFAANILKAGLYFLDNPMERPFIPSWNRVTCAIPHLTEEFIQAVDEDMQEFSI